MAGQSSRGGGRTTRYIVIWVMILATIYVGDQIVRDVFLTADAPRAVTPRGSLAEAESSTIELFQRAAPSVVYLFTHNGRGGGAGSGFVWDRVGHVVTNQHVVADARAIPHHTGDRRESRRYR